jgi:hypothetical protein
VTESKLLSRTRSFSMSRTHWMIVSCNAVLGMLPVGHGQHYARWSLDKEVP